MKFKQILLALFLLLLLSYTNAVEELIPFSETFGTDTFRSTACSNLGSPVFNYTSYLTGDTTVSSTWDNTWYCLMNGGAVNLLNTTKAYDKTVVGFAYTRNTAKGGFGAVFSETYKIKNESILEFSCRDWGLETYLVFGNNNRVIGRFALNSSTSAECSYVGLLSEGEWCSYIDFSCPFGSVKNVSTNFHNLFENGSVTMGEQNLSSITWLAVEVLPISPTDTISIDDLLINFYNGTNVLPYFNISANSSCFDIEDGLATVNYSVTAFDEEGDTIYYSLNALDQFRTYHYIEEDFDMTGFSSSDNFVYANDTVLVTSPDDWFGYYTVIGNQFPSQKNIFFDSVRGVMGVEEKVGYFAFITDEPLADTSSYFPRLSFKDTGVKTDMQILDGYFGIFFNITINYTIDGQLDLYIEGENFYNDYFNDYTEDYLDILIITAPANDTPNMAIQFTNKTDTLATIWHNYTSNEVGGLQFIPVGTSDDYFLVNRILVSGFNVLSSPVSWSGTNSGMLELDTSGIFQIDAYVTDEENLGSRYNRKTFIGSAPYCEYSLEIPYEEVGDIVKSSLLGVCSSMDNLQNMGSFGGRTINYSFCNIIRVLVAILSFILALIIAVIFSFLGGFGFGAFLVSFGIYMILGNIFIITFGTTVKLIIAICVSVGIITSIINIMGSKSNE